MEKLKKDFEALRNHCSKILQEYNLYTNLFCEQNKDILSKVAATFFTDIAEIIHRDWKLQVCKIMDRYEMHGKENITIDLINKQLNDAGLTTNEIEQISEQLKEYGKKIKPARNKRIAHFDRAAQLSGQPLGGTSETELIEFLNNMQCYCDLVGNSIGIGPLGLSCSGCVGDELDLVKYLNTCNGVFNKKSS
ncbi:MAG: hypothetical protein HWE07_11725 [Cytophagia bacterium]|nr:hypothetical protein [Cytophagia bacterium]